MLRNALLEQVRIDVVEAAAAAGTTTLTSDILDMSGYDGVMFIAHLGDVTLDSVVTLQGLTNNTNDTVTPTTVTAAVATVTATADSADNKLLIIDMVRPAERYVYCTLARAAANAVLNGITAIRYRARNHPTTQGASVVDSAIAGPSS